MNNSLNMMNVNDDFELLNTINMKHYIYLNEHFLPLTEASNEIHSSLIHVDISYERLDENIVVKRLELTNQAERQLPINIIVENTFNHSNNDYAFISPKRDVLFLTDEHGLYLTSGMINGRKLSQYGITKKNLIENLSDGRIPFCPIGNGNVAGVYSLEHEIFPYETLTAYTWAISSYSWSEKDLLNIDKHLKSTLDFSLKR